MRHIGFKVKKGPGGGVDDDDDDDDDDGDDDSRGSRDGIPGHRCYYADQEVCLPVWFFTQEDCEEDEDVVYANSGNKGHLPSSDVPIKLQAEGGGPTVFVLSSARKAKLVHDDTLLVTDFTPKELSKASQDEHWQQNLQRVLRAIHGGINSSSWRQLLKDENNQFIKRKREVPLPQPALMAVIDFLAESKEEREREKVNVLKQWPLMFPSLSRR